ncbi:carboxylesterase/lipase family protein [Agarivorans sp. QJM3NY_29]|uniref:carboxylesterase/lipase family protein n=1 Tax=unclassified Agarivorans TaxID=2636026 RepID=UPI003D7C8AEC
MKNYPFKTLLLSAVSLLSMFVSSAFAASPIPPNNQLMVTTGLGQVAGVVKDDIVSFYGVPYAENPFVEGRRFQAPQAKQAWSGVLDASALGAPTPQPSRGVKTELVGAPGDLTLNIWAPAEMGKLPGKLPVMVWIPGGAFIREDAGESVYNGSSYAKQGAIVVTVNYRVGVDGFMHLQGAPDNRGILDQILALQWVQQHIAAFGGDPKQVTLFGQSAGAESVAILLGTPAAKGLFHKAIMQSPPMQAVSTAQATRLSEAFAERFKVAASIEGIASVPYPELVAGVVALGQQIQDREQWGELSWGGTAFLPVMDGKLIVDTPMVNLAKNADPSIPVIVGSTDQEARLYLVPGGQLDRMTNAEVSLFLGDLKLAGKPMQVYSEDGQATQGDIFADIQSDYTFRMPALHIAETLVNNGNPVWHYNFSWRSKAFGGQLGAAHFVDVPFSFNTLATDQAKAFVGSDAPQSLADSMHRQWLDFAKTGQVSWSQYQLNQRYSMRFDAQSKQQRDPEKSRRLLWDGYSF